ncbi:hypothetical protein J5N97_014498 [Dioscorea zingiberensis]|uniref:Rx N-terminal domain-containing protein n=1 Tax=Dioscorea zingiberensis TaxID=325984 RepID=A0A9D5HJP7_9LILI|nr:hypothetical protein J5N97_014498 [Dioscorea zingiberensis]
MSLKRERYAGSLVRLWLKELKGIAYEAEDVLDEYEYELLRCQVESRNAAAAAVRASRKRKSMDEDKQEDICFLSTSILSKQPSFPNDMFDRIRKIKERFSEIEKERNSLSLRELGPRRYDDDSFKSQPTGSSVDESSVFGREGDKEKLIGQLFSDMNCKFSPTSCSKKGKLIRLWMAQGYIRGKASKIMEDVGENYFNELQQRSYFQLYQRPYIQLTVGNAPEWYVMHDMILDLAHFISEKECSSMDISKGPGVQHEISNEVRHLNLKNESDMEGELAELLSVKQPNSLRTFDFLDIRHIDSSESLIMKFGRLRALELEVARPQELLSSIGSFKHLRYLFVKNKKRWERLPELFCHFDLQPEDEV